MTAYNTDVQWISKSTMANYDKRYRVNFVNGLSGYKSAHLVGTVDKRGIYNLAIFSSVFHLGADPALMGMIVRPDSVARHTLENIRSHHFFTLNHVHQGIYHQAHQSSARYPDGVSEFEETGLTPQLIEGFSAPFVQEASVKVLLELDDIVPIKANNTLLVVGKVQAVSLPAEAVSRDGAINYDELDEIAVTGLDSYYQTSHITRLSYAKPNKVLSSV